MKQIPIPTHKPASEHFDDADVASPLLSLSSILSYFHPVHLTDIGDASLMDRREEKYLITEDQALEILRTLPQDYHVLEIDGARVCGYETLYFDTERYETYLQHHNGRLNRYKVRSRRYQSTDQSFFEVKQKVNNGRSIKRRIQTEGMVTRIESYLRDFISTCYPEDVDFIPRLFNTYSRVTLVSPDHAERVTMDFNLSYAHEQKEMSLAGLVIVEVKIPERGTFSPIRSVFRVMRIRSSSFSKYCIGVSLLCGDVKKNRFKPKLRKISAMVQGRPGVCL